MVSRTRGLNCPSAGRMSDGCLRFFVSGQGQQNGVFADHGQIALSRQRLRTQPSRSFNAAQPNTIFHWRCRQHRKRNRTVQTVPAWHLHLIDFVMVIAPLTAVANTHAIALRAFHRPCQWHAAESHFQRLHNLLRRQTKARHAFMIKP